MKSYPNNFTGNGNEFVELPITISDIPDTVTEKERKKLKERIQVVNKNISNIEKLFNHNRKNTNPVPQSITRININKKKLDSLSNKRHKEQVFSPDPYSNLHLQVKNPHTIVNSQKINFHFVMCQFGPNLQVSGNKSDPTHKEYLISHHLKDDLCYTHLHYNEQISPYEAMMLSIFDKKHVPLMNRIAQDRHFTIRWHLPITDYLLTGIDQYIRNVISLKVFRKYHKLVLERGAKLKNIIKGIADKHKIDIAIESPYDNLNLVDMNWDRVLLELTPNQSGDHFQQFIKDHHEFFEKLKDLWKTQYTGSDHSDDSTTESDNGEGEKPFDNALNIRHFTFVLNACDYPASKKQQIRRDYLKLIVTRLVQLLQSNELNQDHQSLWKTVDVNSILEHGKKDASPIDAFFHYGNTSMILQCLNDSDTYSILPQDEISIYNNFDKNYKHVNDKKNSCGLVAWMDTDFIQTINEGNRLFYLEDNNNLCQKIISYYGTANLFYEFKSNQESTPFLPGDVTVDLENGKVISRSDSCVRLFKLPQSCDKNVNEHVYMVKV